MTNTAHEELPDEEFFADLIEDSELAKIFHVDPKSIPVMRCRGKIPIPTYRRGRKTLSSRRAAIALVKASRVAYCG